MKKLTLLLIAALATLTVAAGPAQKHQKRSLAQEADAHKAVRQIPSARLLQFSDAPAAAATAKRAKSRADGELIWERPEGEHHYCFQYGDGFTLFDDMLFNFPVETAGEVVWGADNTVYLKNAISPFQKTGWVKGTKSADGKKITIQYPQCVQVQEGIDEQGRAHVVPFYVSVMRYNQANNDYIPVAAKDNFVTYTIQDDGKIVMDGARVIEYIKDPLTEEELPVMPDTMLTCYYEYDPYGDGRLVQYWYGHADVSQELVPLPDDLIVNEYPTGLSFALWGLTDAVGMSKSVDVAVAGNEIFIKDIDEYTSDCIVKGTIEGDKAVFPSKQFFGVHKEYNDFMFFFGCTYGLRWFDDFQDYYDGYTLADNIVMDYDPQRRILTARDSTGFVMNSILADIRYYSAYLKPTIASQNPADLYGAPKDPQFAMYEDYSADYGQTFFAWMLPNKNVNDVFIDTNKMYYNVYINRQLYTFTPEQYIFVPEAITDLPYKYSDDNAYDIVANGEEHVFYIVGDAPKTFGIMMYYLAPDGTLYNSNCVTYNVVEDKIETDKSAIDTPLSAEPAAMEFANIQGMKVKSLTPGGIYLRTVTFKDGSKKTAKMIAR